MQRGHMQCSYEGKCPFFISRFPFPFLRSWFYQFPDDRSYSCLPWRSLVGDFAQTHSINGFSLVRQWSCNCPATNCQCACVNQKRPMSLLNCTAVLWRSYRQRRDTELTTVPACTLFVDIEPYRLTVLRHHWLPTGTAGYVHSYGHNIDPLGANEVHLSCRISPTHVAAAIWRIIWRPSLSGVNNTHTMPYLSEKKQHYLSHQ